MIFVVSLPVDTPFYRMRCTFDESDYLVDMAWNGRVGAWFLSLYAADETPLVLSLKVVSNRPLLKHFKWIAGMPAGDLVAVDPTDSITAADYTQLGDTIALLYLDAAEVAAL